MSPLDVASMPAGEFEDGVRQEREDVEGRQRVGQVFLAVPAIAGDRQIEARPVPPAAVAGAVLPRTGRVTPDKRPV